MWIGIWTGLKGLRYGSEHQCVRAFSVWSKLGDSRTDGSESHRLQTCWHGRKSDRQWSLRSAGRWRTVERWSLVVLRRRVSREDAGLEWFFQDFLLFLRLHAKLLPWIARGIKFPCVSDVVSLGVLVCSRHLRLRTRPLGLLPEGSRRLCRCCCYCCVRARRGLT